MLTLRLALKSLLNRRLTSCLTLMSVTLSVALLIGVERVRLAARDSFHNTISQTDLIVGGRGGTIQLLLYAVFGMGSATAATIMDLLSAIQPKAVLFLGKCGGVKHRAELGDLILPIAAVRGEGTSNDYFPPEVPALPSFALQKAISTTIRDAARDYWTGTVYTTNRRVWEHDEKFKAYLRKIRVMAVDMETATIFMTGFFNEIPTGALLLVSDQPMVPEGIKTEESDRKVDQQFVADHLRIGIDALKQLLNKGLTVKHLKF